jgi:hypothetical protein
MNQIIIRDSAGTQALAGQRNIAEDEHIDNNCIIKLKMDTVNPRS